MDFLEVKVTIDKKMLPTLAAERGKWNADEIKLPMPLGAWKRGTLTFSGFAGAIDVKTRKYIGVLRFRRGKSDGDPLSDFPWLDECLRRVRNAFSESIAKPKR